MLRTAVLLAALNFAAAAQEHGGGHGESHEGDPYLVWKIINFAILAAGLAFVALKIGGPALRERAEGIRKSIADSQQVREDAEKRAAAIEAKIANLATELEALRANSKKEMASEEARISEETRRQAAKLEENAAHEISQAAKRAEHELRDHAAKLAVEIAEGRVKAQLTSSTQASLVRRFVDDLGKRVN
ncbi:MAG: ATP synthase F0 subunit B [Bryobacteraceae bacterium]